MSQRKEKSAPNEGLQRGGSGSESKHAPGVVSMAAGSQGQLPIISLQGGGGAGGNSAAPVGGPSSSSTSSSRTSHGYNRGSESDERPELDPHICKQWPCPRCHKPRDADDDDEMTARPAVEAGQQYSAEASTSTQSKFFHPHVEPVVQAVEQSGDADDALLLDIDATSAPVSHASSTQEHKGHHS